MKHLPQYYTIAVFKAVKDVVKSVVHEEKTWRDPKEQYTGSPITVISYTHLPCILNLVKVLAN